MKIKFIFTVLLCCVWNLVFAEPTSAPVKIGMIRPYVNGNIYIHLESNLDICPQGSVFIIPGGAPGTNAMYAVALAAFAADKPVRIEIPAAGQCVWGQTIQSIYIVKQ